MSCLGDGGSSVRPSIRLLQYSLPRLYFAPVFFPVLLTGCSATEVAETAAGTVRTAEAAAAAALKRNKDQNLSSF